ncbi:hypothetical protein ACFY1B_49170 [Streptomyces mirabilis]|uniref:hypothetical protein n=1 Tax=Streptomyces mirabilis TaxID=68239 RepID=UPI0036B205F3
MPLRLARYGVPLAETAPSGLAAAGIEAPILFTLERVPDPVQPEGSALEAAADGEQEVAELEESEPRPVQVPAAAPERVLGPRDSSEDAAERFAGAYQEFIAQFQVEPTAAQWAFGLRDQYGISAGASDPLSEAQLQPLLQVLQNRYAIPAVETTGVKEPQPTDRSWYDYFYSAWRSYEQERGDYPDAGALAAYVYERDGVTGAGDRPISGEDLDDFVVSFRRREFDDAELPAEEAVADSGEQEVDGPLPEAEAPSSVPAGAAAQAAKEQRRPRVDAPIDEPPPAPAGAVEERVALTTVDRYYLAWVEYQQQRDAEPNGDDLSKYLGEKGVVGRNGRAAAASTLRRYLLPFRIYSVWAEHRVRSEQPSLTAVAEACAARGVTLQYNEPITAATIAEHTADFERRWHAVIRHRTDAVARSR